MDVSCRGRRRRRSCGTAARPSPRKRPRGRAAGPVARARGRWAAEVGAIEETAGRRRAVPVDQTARRPRGARSMGRRHSQACGGATVGRGRGTTAAERGPRQPWVCGCCRLGVRRRARRGTCVGPLLPAGWPRGRRRGPGRRATASNEGAAERYGVASASKAAGRPRGHGRGTPAGPPLPAKPGERSRDGGSGHATADEAVGRPRDRRRERGRRVTASGEAAGWP